MNKIIKQKRKKKFFIFMGIILTICFLLDLKLRPIIKTVATNKARMLATQAINESVLQEINNLDISYSNLVRIERGNSGKVIALTTDSRLVNQIKSRISMTIQNRLSDANINKMYIPLGTLIGAEFCSGFGPLVPLRVSIAGSVITEFESKFCDAGINQTKHQIYINIHTKIGVLLPGYITASNIDTNINIAETIIVGEVPNVYAPGDSTWAKNFPEGEYSDNNVER